MRTPLSEVRHAARLLMKPFAVEYIAVCGPPKLATDDTSQRVSRGLQCKNACSLLAPKALALSWLKSR